MVVVYKTSPSDLFCALVDRVMRNLRTTLHLQHLLPVKLQLHRSPLFLQVRTAQQQQSKHGRHRYISCYYIFLLFFVIASY